MNLGKKFSRFLGRSLSMPTKLISESISFVKKAIGGFGGMKGGFVEVELKKMMKC